MGELDNLWAGWRSTYIESVSSTDNVGGGVDGASDGDGGGDGLSLFERILASSGDDDEHGFIVHRGVECFAILNAYPYTNGHLLVMPNRAVTDLESLSASEHTELWDMVRDATVAMRMAYGCDGINVGLNLGRAAGAGVPGHVHVHVLPRWAGDTNFMTSVAGARVMPESLDSSWAKLRDAWPTSSP